MESKLRSTQIQEIIRPKHYSEILHVMVCMVILCSGHELVVGVVHFLILVCCLLYVNI